MKLALTVLATTFFLAFPSAQVFAAEGNLEPLIASLEHPDRQIREAAQNVLLDEDLSATPPLVAAILKSENSMRLSSAAAMVLVERLSLLPDRWNDADRTNPVINLTESDKEQLKPLVDYVRNSSQRLNWRWYLATNVLDQVDAAALLNVLPALIQALNSNDAMLQYGAVKALFHNSNREAAQAAKPALLNLLYRPRRPFQGIYLRGNRLIEENQVSYTNDVRVYSDVDTQQSYTRRERHFGHGDLLISDTLLRLGATYDELGPRLGSMAAFDIPSIRLRAIRQLVQLGPNGQRVAAQNLRRLLLDGDEYLIRRLADEHPSLIGVVPMDDPDEQLKVVRAFSQLGDSAKLVIAPLSGLLRNGDDRVRHVAANILGQIGTQDTSTALKGLRTALASEAVAPLAAMLKTPFADETVDKIMDEIARQDMVASLDDLRSISERLVFDNPQRPVQEAAYRAMLDAALKLQAAQNDSEKNLEVLPRNSD